MDHIDDDMGKTRRESARCFKTSSAASSAHLIKAFLANQACINVVIRLDESPGRAPIWYHVPPSLRPFDLGPTPTQLLTTLALLFLLLGRPRPTDSMMLVRTRRASLCRGRDRQIVMSTYMGKPFNLAAATLDLPKACSTWAPPRPSNIELFQRLLPFYLQFHFQFEIKSTIAMDFFC